MWAPPWGHIWAYGPKGAQMGKSPRGASYDICFIECSCSILKHDTFGVFSVTFGFVFGRVFSKNWQSPGCSMMRLLQLCDVYEQP
jgi:hypothetical protein